MQCPLVETWTNRAGPAPQWEKRKEWETAVSSAWLQQCWRAGNGTGRVLPALTQVRGPGPCPGVARLQVLPISLPGVLTSPKSCQCSWLLYWERERGGLGLRALDRWTGSRVWKGRREASSRSREGGKGKQVTRRSSRGRRRPHTHTRS